jgi:hypothetical protein
MLVSSLGEDVKLMEQLALKMQLIVTTPTLTLV